MSIKDDLHTLIHTLDEDTAAVVLAHFQKMFDTEHREPRRVGVRDLSEDTWHDDEAIDEFIAEIRELRRQDGYPN